MIQSSKSFTIEQWVATDKFRDGWDRIFGKKETADADNQSEKRVSCTDQQIDADNEHCTDHVINGVCCGCIIQRGTESDGVRDLKE